MISPKEDLGLLQEGLLGLPNHNEIPISNRITEIRTLNPNNLVANNGKKGARCGQGGLIAIAPAPPWCSSCEEMGADGELDVKREKKEELCGASSTISPAPHETLIPCP